MNKLMQLVFMFLFYFKHCFEVNLETCINICAWTCRFRKRYNFLYENDLPAERQVAFQIIKCRIFSMAYSMDSSHFIISV